jgi:hypothetical protein
MASIWDKSRVPAYLYSFDHISENLFVDNSDSHSMFDRLRLTVTHMFSVGAFHGSDMILLFETDFEFLKERKDKNWQLDRRVTEIFAELLTNFAKYG